MPTICEKGGRGLVFPLFEAEHTWSPVLSTILYGVGLVYFFFGVAIVSDIFMGSIEKITSRRVQARDAAGRVRTAMLWNETVATLTLMALGSSAPEIFLSVIDMVKKNFHFGHLGPATIVGSASFNLLVIISVCVFAIPTGDVRWITNRPAFYITAAFSLFAYVWLAGIVTQISPGIVDVWEAVVTFMLLPIMVFVSYKTDRGDFEYLVKFFHRFGHEDRVGSEDTAPEDIVKFVSDRLMIRGYPKDKKIEISVKRQGLCESLAKVSYRTEGLTAVPGFDYEEVEGVLEFAAGETVKHIELEILAKPEWRSACNLLIVLFDAEDPMGFDEEDDGGKDETYLTVAVDRTAASSRLGFWTRVDAIVNFRGWRRGHEDWKEQVVGVLYVNGSAEEQAEASRADWAMHFISLPWKIVFGWLPPPALLGGWLAFVVSLFGIAGVTACISDLAELFGCVLEIPDIVTAFTFVALGTSMPDLFASLTAAKDDPTADASIVNVTGSNSVNVFLGLGVPWTMATLYWKINGRDADWEVRYPETAAAIEGAAFVVESMNLGFVVLSFCVVSCVALMLLHLRRSWLGGELGGSMASKINTFSCFISMWLGWVALCSWRILRFREDWGMEPYIVQGTAVCVLIVGFGLSTWQMKLVSVRFRRSQRQLTTAASQREQAALKKRCRSSLTKNSENSRGSSDRPSVHSAESPDNNGEEPDRST